MLAASLSSEIVLFLAVGAAVLAWRLIRPSSGRGGTTRSGRARLTKKRNVITVTKSIKLPEGTIGPDGVHIDEATRAELEKAGLDPADLQRAFADVEDLKPGEVKTVIDVHSDGGPVDAEARAMIGEELERLGIDHTDVDAKLARGESFHTEQGPQHEK